MIITNIKAINPLKSINTKSLAFSLILMTVCAAIVAAQCRPAYRERGNCGYKEGYYDRQEISGERLELVGASAILDNDDSSDRNNIPPKNNTLYLEFQLPSSELCSEGVELAIRAVSENYRLSEVAHSYHEGHNCFAWNSEIVNCMEIQCNKLLATVYCRNNEKHIYPSVISTSMLEQPTKITAYRFYFLPSNSGSVQYSIRSGDVRHQGRQKAAIADQVLFIEVSANELTPGECSLEVVFTFQSRGSSSSATTNYTFDHKKIFSSLSHH